MPCSEEMSPEKPSTRVSPTTALISCAVFSLASRLRETTRTRAPPQESAPAMILPIPLDPPVTSAVLPATEKSLSRYPIA